jgi:hypothetical protein
MFVTKCDPLQEPQPLFFFAVPASASSAPASSASASLPGDSCIPRRCFADRTCCCRYR